MDSSVLSRGWTPEISLPRGFDPCRLCRINHAGFFAVSTGDPSSNVSALFIANLYTDRQFDGRSKSFIKPRTSIFIVVHILLSCLVHAPPRKCPCVRNFPHPLDSPIFSVLNRPKSPPPGSCPPVVPCKGFAWKHPLRGDVCAERVRCGYL